MQQTTKRPAPTAEEIAERKRADRAAALAALAAGPTLAEDLAGLRYTERRGL